MNGRSFDTPRGARALGGNVADSMVPFELARGVHRPQRRDLLLDPSTLQTARDVPLSDVQFTADPMAFGDFAHINFSAGLVSTGVPILTRPDNKRVFLLIENTHATQSIFVGFGINNPGPTIGVTITAGGSFLLDTRVPQNDIYLAASGADTTGKLTYCNQAYGHG
jgi:hypothetical protein